MCYNVPVLFTDEHAQSSASTSKHTMVGQRCQNLLSNGLLGHDDLQGNHEHIANEIEIQQDAACGVKQDPQHHAKDVDEGNHQNGPGRDDLMAFSRSMFQILLVVDHESEEQLDSNAGDQ